MKTAISIPDDVFRSAESLAEDMGLSRSELYARAVAEYVARERQRDITARLNEVYGREPAGLDPDVRAALARSLRAAEW